MPIELTVQHLGLTPTGNEDYYNPRRSYNLTEQGTKNLNKFFNSNLSYPRKQPVWLTPAIIEDFLIFHAFETEGFKAVFIESNDDTRTLYGTKDDKIINNLIESNVETYINPRLFLPTH